MMSNLKIAGAFLLVIHLVNAQTFCPNGQYGATSASCSNCPANNTSVSGSNLTSSTCTPCLANQSSISGTDCQNCPSNYTSIAGSSCTACSANFQSISGSSCFACPSGYQSTSGYSCTIISSKIISAVVSLASLLLLFI